MFNKFLEIEIGKPPRKFAKFEVIQRAYLIDKFTNEHPVSKKLTDLHFIERKIKKMNVQVAAETLSDTVVRTILNISHDQCKC